MYILDSLTSAAVISLLHFAAAAAYGRHGLTVCGVCVGVCVFFFFNVPATTEIDTIAYTLSRHDALPIWCVCVCVWYVSVHVCAPVCACPCVWVWVCVCMYVCVSMCIKPLGGPNPGGECKERGGGQVKPPGPLSPGANLKKWGGGGRGPPPGSLFWPPGAHPAGGGVI